MEFYQRLLSKHILEDYDGGELEARRMADGEYRKWRSTVPRGNPELQVLKGRAGKYGGYMSDRAFSKLCCEIGFDAACGEAERLAAESVAAKRRDVIMDG